MKKYLRIILLMILVLLISAFFSYSVFAEEKIGTVAIKQEEQELTVPSSEYKIEEGKDYSSLDKIRVKALATGNHDDPITISDASAFNSDELSDGTLTITGLKEKNTNYYKIIIPDTINGKKVSTIAEEAFFQDGHLIGVTLGKNVTTIGAFSFYNCVFLESVNLANVKVIGDYAFIYSSLEGSLVIPDTVEYIGTEAFKGNDIEYVTIGKNITYFNQSYFAYCYIKEYTVSSSNANFISVNGIIYNKEKTELIAYPMYKEDKVYTLPSTVTTIRPNAAFGSKYIETLKFNDNIETIPASSFTGCESLKNVIFGKNVKTLASNCFSACGIETITIPASVTSIASTSFLECENLKNVNVESGNTQYASIDGVLFSKDKKTLIYYPIGKQDTSYVIPNGTEAIGSSGCQGANFTSVTIPSSVKTIDSWAFAQCNKLTSITIPSSVTKYGNGVFFECKELTKATINSSTNLIYKMFSNCDKLASVTLNSNIKIIEGHVFFANNALTQITLPANLEEIQSWAFMGSGINSVTIPANVKYIAKRAFKDNTQIDISKTRLIKLSNGSYRIVGTVYINGTFDYKKAYECLDILNKERKALGLSELEMDKEVLEASMTRAAETALLFEHTRPNGTSFYTDAVGKIESENIAVGSSTAQGAITQWMNSSFHKENMLTPSWKFVGIGCFTTPNGLTCWVQNFGKGEATTNTSTPANVTKDVKIQTVEENIELLWRDTRTTTKTADMNINDVLNLNISTKNKGWDGATTYLLNKSFNFKSSDTKIATVDSNGKVTAKKPGKAIITATIKDLPTKSISMTVNVKLPFKDVETSSWYFNAVAYVYNNNIMSGLNSTTFAPNKKVTRGMLASIIYKMEGAPKVTGTVKFTDMKDTTKWYYKAVLWASNKKIVNGYSNGKYGPEDCVTREQLAVILNSYAKFKKKDVSKTNNLKGFSDSDKVSSWALAQVKWAVGSGVITGSTNKTTGKVSINPKGQATRAEIAAMIQKYCINVGK